MIQTTLHCKFKKGPVYFDHPRHYRTSHHREFPDGTVSQCHGGAEVLPYAQCAAQSAAMVRLSMYWDVDVGVDIEDIHRYTTGGFHPICLGDVLPSTKAQYRVLHKLGRGAFSTVWLAETLQEPL